LSNVPKIPNIINAIPESMIFNDFITISPLRIYFTIT
jgi:hypothetical protein